MNKDTLIYLSKKTKKTLKEEGVLSVVGKTKGYIAKNVFNNYGEQMAKDILFINGCTLPHPKRYRVEHQIEQLESYGTSADYINYEQLNADIMKYYRGFIFFRCPITPEVQRLVTLAKTQNKKIFFDIDDLVIDTKYTNEIEHVQKMSAEDKKVYDDGVNRTQETLKLCDYAITTTEALAEELRKYVNDVYINRNTASDRMVELSVNALHEEKREDDKIIMGYLSGSITHNADVRLILPVIKKMLSKYTNLYLRIAGELDVPKELEEFRDRIIATPFTAWQNLPEIIASLDINLAPLEDTIFNRAKSENKWIEAALCKRVTIASNVGAFSKMIADGKTGVLCADSEAWCSKLEKLITNKEYREEIGRNAYDQVIDKNVTIYTGKGLADYIESKLARNIAFVLPTTNISGGVNVVLKHCAILRSQGMDVSIINRDKPDTDIVNLDGIIPVISANKTTITMQINTIVATLWDTLNFGLGYPKVKNIKYIVQNFETDFMKYGQYARVLANATYSTYKSISYITISKWCQDWLETKYSKTSIYAPNGINLNQFSYKERTFNGKIKILIEGNSLDHYKNVDESFKIVEKLDKNKYEIHFLSYQGKPKKWYHVDKFMHQVPYDEVGKVYQDADILIKSSLLESFSYPPLEMMATGGLVVAVANGGNIEYLKNEYNCLFYKQGDIQDALDKIESLRVNEDLRATLLKNGKSTAQDRAWQSVQTDILKLYDEE